MFGIEARIILAVFATLRMADLLTIDEGPLRVFARLRETIGKQANRGEFWKSLADLFHCPYCMGIWASALSIIFIMIQADMVLLLLGLAGAQTVFLGRRE